MKKGLWNGQEHVTFTGFTYEVKAVPEVPCHWQNAVAGTTRQGVLVAHESGEFMMDNEHAQANYKLIVGMGSPQFGHKSIAFPLNIKPIPDNEIYQVYDPISLEKEEELFSEHCKKADPEIHKKMESIKSMLNKK